MSYRGFRGGGYRGRRGGGGGGGWRGGNRSFNESSEDRFSSFDRPRGSLRGRKERFSDRGRDSFKRPFRQENRDFLDQDFGRDPSPKRLRRDSPFGGGISRRSRERSFNGSGHEYSGRSFFSSDKRSSDGYRDDGGSFREISESRAGNYSFRKPRGSRFRGRGRSSFPRGSNRSRGFRKKPFPSRSQDHLERLYSKLKRRLREEEEKHDKSDEGDSDWDNDIEDKDDDDEKEEGMSGDEDLEGKDDDDGDEEDEGKDKEEVGDEEDEDKEDMEVGDEGGADGEGEKSKDEEGKAKAKEGKKLKDESKSPKKTDEHSKGTEDGKEKEETDEKGKATGAAGTSKQRLRCIHCGYSSIIYKEYDLHLKSKKHVTAMKAVFMRLRETLARMRLEQRRKQRVLDQQNERNLKLRSIFCNICKLNYRMYKSEHTKSSAHRRMEEFLYPLCRTCLVSFKTPMRYEEHICDLDHIKKKLKQRGKGGSDSGEEDAEAPDLDSDKFLVLDAVGSGDESEEEEGKMDEKDSEKLDDDSKSKDKESDGEKKTQKPEFGSDFCKLVEVYMCDLCKFYLPKKSDKLKSVLKHCQTRNHIQKWRREIQFQKRKVALAKAKELAAAKKAAALKKVAKKAVKVKGEEVGAEKEDEEDDGKEEEKETSAQDGEGMDVGSPVKKEESSKKKVVGKKEVKAEGDSGAGGGETIEVEDRSGGDSEGGAAKQGGGEGGAGGEEDKAWSEMDKDLSNLLTEVEEANASSEDEEEGGTVAKKVKSSAPSQANGDIAQVEKGKV